MSLLSGIQTSSKLFISTSQPDANSHRRWCESEDVNWSPLLPLYWVGISKEPGKSSERAGNPKWILQMSKQGWDESIVWLCTGWDVYIWNEMATDPHTATLPLSLTRSLHLWYCKPYHTQMNNLFEHTSEDPDDKICNLAMENLRLICLTEHAHFFDLFSTRPALAWMYNQLDEGDKEDWWAYVRLKLKSLVD